MATLHRRRFVRVAALGGLALAAVPREAQAGVGQIHLRLGPTLRQFHPVPSRTRYELPWPTTAEAFPDVRGLVSPDRRSVLLADPGAYLITWGVTFGQGNGKMRKTALRSTRPDGTWRDGTDGNEVAPVQDRETTLLGTAWVRSDGSVRVQVTAEHDHDGPLTISDRPYECYFEIVWMHP